MIILKERVQTHWSHWYLRVKFRTHVICNGFVFDNMCFLFHISYYLRIYYKSRISSWVLASIASYTSYGALSPAVLCISYNLIEKKIDFIYNQIQL